MKFLEPEPVGDARIRFRMADTMSFTLANARFEGADMGERDVTLYEVRIYPLTSEAGGGFAAVAPGLSGCRSDGETPEEALANGYDAIACWIEAANEMGRAVPQPKRMTI